MPSSCKGTYMFVPHLDKSISIDHIRKQFPGHACVKIKPAYCIEVTEYIFDNDIYPQSPYGEFIPALTDSMKSLKHDLQKELHYKINEYIFQYIQENNRLKREIYMLQKYYQSLTTNTNIWKRQHHY